MSDISPEPESISETELSIMLGKSTRALAYWRHEGISPKFYREGRTIRYRLADIEDFKINHTSRLKLSTEVKK